jgi:predicted RNA-binding protein with PUA-like domain
MAYWLLKTEPSVYSFDDLVRDKKTTWDGVTNALALKHIRTMKPGDEALIYHTGDERQAIGTAKIVTAAFADPKQENPKLAVVDLAVGKRLKRPVTLAEVKGDKRFEGWDLLRLGRLSVVPTTAEQWAWVLKLGNG